MEGQWRYTEELHLLVLGPRRSLLLVTATDPLDVGIRDKLLLLDDPTPETLGRVWT